MIKSLVLSLAASLFLVLPASAAVSSTVVVVGDEVSGKFVPGDACKAPPYEAETLFVEATTDGHPLLAELTGLCLVPVDVEVRQVGHVRPPDLSMSCASIRASPD